jgi:hypothetical protein
VLASLITALNVRVVSLTIFFKYTGEVTAALPLIVTIPSEIKLIVSEALYNIIFAVAVTVSDGAAGGVGAGVGVDESFLLQPKIKITNMIKPQ